MMDRPSPRQPTLDDLLPEAFAACREAACRTKNMRHFDVQILGGVVLHRGNIAEMVTGEGKTLVATLPAYLNALDRQGRPRRHRQRLPRPPRLRVDVADLPRPRHHLRLHPERHGPGRPPQGLRLRHHLRHQQRVRLRLPARQHEAGPLGRSATIDPYYQQCQQALNFAIIDEVDNILIDEARTPLIITGPAFGDVRCYAKANEIAVQLTELEKKAQCKLRTSATASTSDHPLTRRDEGEAIRKEVTKGQEAKEAERRRDDEEMESSTSPAAEERRRRSGSATTSRSRRRSTPAT